MMNNMSVVFTIGDFLRAHEITPYRLSRETNINFNTIYGIVNNKAKRVDRETLNSILTSLEELTGKSLEVSDVLAFTRDVKEGVS